MKYLEVVKLVSDRVMIRQDAVKKVLRGLRMVMIDAIEEGEVIRLNLGTFEYRVHANKPAYDFKENKKIILPPMSYLVYRPSLKIQQALKEKDVQMAFDFAKKKNNEKTK